jgi:hypothetical protein
LQGQQCIPAPFSIFHDIDLIFMALIWPAPFKGQRRPQQRHNGGSARHPANSAKW